MATIKARDGKILFTASGKLATSCGGCPDTLFVTFSGIQGCICWYRIDTDGRSHDGGLTIANALNGTHALSKVSDSLYSKTIDIVVNLYPSQDCTGTPSVLARSLTITVEFSPTAATVLVNYGSPFGGALQFSGSFDTNLGCRVNYGTCENTIFLDGCAGGNELGADDGSAVVYTA